MTHEEYKELTEISNDVFKANRLLKAWLEAHPPTEKEEGDYTPQQRKGAWLWMRLYASNLNNAGLDQRKVLKETYDIPWTEQAFHDHVWIPVQKAMFGTESMTKLKKDQVTKIQEVISRELAEKHGVEIIPFPDAAFSPFSYPDPGGDVTPKF